MNIVRARSRMLGQDVEFPFPIDTTPGPTDTTPSGDGYTPFPFPLDTPTPPTVHKPPSGSPIYATFGPYGTLDPTAAGTMAPTTSTSQPAPRVNIPLSTPSGFLSSSLAGIPMIAWLGIGIVGVLALSGGRRRR